MKALEAGRHQEKAAQSAYEHREPEPDGPHRCRAGQEGDGVQRWETDDCGDQNDRQSPAFLSHQVKQLSHGRAEPRTSRPDWAFLSNLPPMLDEGQLLSLANAEEKYELPHCLADCNADSDGNRPDDGRHLRSNDICLG